MNLWGWGNAVSTKCAAVQRRIYLLWLVSPVEQLASPAFFVEGKNIWEVDIYYFPWYGLVRREVELNIERCRWDTLICPTLSRLTDPCPLVLLAISRIHEPPPPAIIRLNQERQIQWILNAPTEKNIFDIMIHLVLGVEEWIPEVWRQNVQTERKANKEPTEG